VIQLQEASAKGPSKPLLLHTAEQGDLPSHQLGYQSLRAVLNVGLSRAGFQLRDWITGATHTYSVCRGGWPPPAPAAVPRIASTHEKSVFLGLSQWTEQDTVPSGREAERGDSEVNQRADEKQRKESGESHSQCSSSVPIFSWCVRGKTCLVPLFYTRRPAQSGAASASPGSQHVQTSAVREKFQGALGTTKPLGQSSFFSCGSRAGCTR
jgi:hypothetical protein